MYHDPPFRLLQAPLVVRDDTGFELGSADTLYEYFQGESIIEL